MRPTYGPGDLLLGLRLHALVRPGRVLVVRRPGRVVVKRALRREGAGWWVQGDNPDPAASTDSRSFGAVPVGDVEAVVLARLARGRDPGGSAPARTA